MKIVRSMAAAGLAVICLVSGANAQVTVEDAWLRASVGAGKNTAGYAVIRNGGDTADELLSVRTPIAAVVELHESRSEDGVMSMRPVGNVLVPPHDSIELRPGGFHLMIMGLNGPLRAGDVVKLQLVFRSAGTIEASAKVMPVSATGPK
jgi:hypothetical protein